ncbi:MAG: hypothetical protein J5747_13085 [Spirochaetaceae bacterium]|nr:hypothetical protein [Spirochaetaceae bacterium]
MKMNKIAFAVIAALCAFTFFSCDLLMNPILPESILRYAPEPGELDEVSTEDLANAASDISVVADPDAAKAIIEALGQKPASEIEALSDEQKSAILALTTSAILPVNTLLGTVYDLISGEVSHIVLDVPVNRTENGAGEEDAQILQVMKSIVSKISFIDTTAAEQILLAMTDDDAEISSRDVPNVLFATLSIAISACKSNLLDFENDELPASAAGALEDLAEFFEGSSSQTPASVANGVLTALSKNGVVVERAKLALANALEIVKRLSQQDITLENITSYIGFGA